MKGYVINFIGDDGAYRTKVVLDLKTALQRILSMRGNNIPCELVPVNIKHKEQGS